MIPNQSTLPDGLILVQIRITQKVSRRNFQNVHCLLVTDNHLTFYQIGYYSFPVYPIILREFCYFLRFDSNQVTETKILQNNI